MPLARLTTASTFPDNGAMSPSTARKPWEGTAMKTMLTPSSASSSEDVTLKPSGRRTSAR